jgi:hypothetical protein
MNPGDVSMHLPSILWGISNFLNVTDTNNLFIVSQLQPHNHGPLGRPTGAEVTELGAWYFL